MASEKTTRRGRAQAKQARELAKADAAKAEAAARKGKPTPAEVLKAAIDRR